MHASRYGTIDEYFRLIDTAQEGFPSYGSDFFPLGTNNNIYTSQLDPNPKDSENECVLDVALIFVQGTHIDEPAVVHAL
jgi:hypothetical protein